MFSINNHLSIVWLNKHWLLLATEEMWNWLKLTRKLRLRQIIAKKSWNSHLYFQHFISISIFVQQSPKLLNNVKFVFTCQTQQKPRGNLWCKDLLCSGIDGRKRSCNTNVWGLTAHQLPFFDQRWLLRRLLVGWSRAWVFGSEFSPFCTGQYRPCMGKLLWIWSTKWKI